MHSSVRLATASKATWAAVILFAFVMTPTLALADGGGNVMPPNSNPHGYSLTDMAAKLALFNTYGNDMQYCPKTPFQILFQDPSKLNVVPTACPVPPATGYLFTGGNVFSAVAPGTPFFVPLWSVDDSPPVMEPFPLQPSMAPYYFFDQSQVGARDVEVIVDGKTTKINRSYVAGPVYSAKPLGDGGGHNLIQLGVFLTPMSKGTHTVTIKGQMAGDLVGLTYPPPDGFACLQESFTYVVTVSK